ncbi:hypothetical protein CBR_g53770 [Chara braunii]|uniref:Uncharacterized protein n=1 Tax=Chara braunii TaxID=69332 RepID=A0A388K6X3_CHABU|nr:hypothetical protein CBR_g53770 [Chara braunii]|eukprot:GBG65800.1 hypothetical protein CBR_g53770 [Chara braunii]
MPGRTSTGANVSRQLVNEGFTATVLLKAYLEENLTKQECLRRAREFTHEHKAEVLTCLTFQTKVTYEVMVWSAGYLQAELFFDETVPEARSRVRVGTLGMTQREPVLYRHRRRTSYSLRWDQRGSDDRNPRVIMQKVVPRRRLPTNGRHRLSSQLLSYSCTVSRHLARDEVMLQRKYVKWADDLGDVSMFHSMKDSVEARRVRPSKGKEAAKSQSVRMTLSSDEESPTTPIRVATTKSARGSSSRKTDTDYVMPEKDGQRIEEEEVTLSPIKRGAKKFTMRSFLDDIDTVESLRRVLRQPMQCSILEYLAASRPARDELQMITRNTRVPLGDEVQVAPKPKVPIVAVSGVSAKAECAATL